MQNSDEVLEKIYGIVNEGMDKVIQVRDKEIRELKQRIFEIDQKWGSSVERANQAENKVRKLEFSIKKLEEVVKEKDSSIACLVGMGHFISKNHGCAVEFVQDGEQFGDSEHGFMGGYVQNGFKVHVGGKQEVFIFDQYSF